MRREMNPEAEEEEVNIAIVGAGICGLATALALHRKGLKSVVLERSESLRTTGAAIGVLANGWRALEQLGVAAKLRETACLIQETRYKEQDGAKERRSPISSGEARCLIRSVLIETLAEELPFGTIRFDCQLDSLMFDPVTALPVLHLVDGRTIKAIVLIGCDGANSVVAKFLKLKPLKASSLSGIRGFTNYPSGHKFPSEFSRVRGKNGAFSGQIPVNSNLVYWFIGLHDVSSADAKVTWDVESIKRLAVESTKDFPAATAQMVANSDQESLSMARLRYRAPWDILTGSFREGTVTVAGDAMHVMGPFLGQGGSAALEDAVVLARCLSRKLRQLQFNAATIDAEIGEGLDDFIKERRMRLVSLSTQTFLVGSLLARDTSFLVKSLCLLMLVVLFRDSVGHTRYDCGVLT